MPRLRVTILPPVSYTHLDVYKRQDYDGVARLGIEALALKLQGMRVTDIAELYQVPPSHVGAWISRSVAKLRSDPAFWQACFDFVENHGLPAVKDIYKEALIDGTEKLIYCYRPSGAVIAARQMALDSLKQE